MPGATDVTRVTPTGVLLFAQICRVRAAPRPRFRASMS